MTEEQRDNEHGLALDEAKPRLKRPPLYQVLLLNDDYTPMDFVVEVLERIFGMDRAKAFQIYLDRIAQHRANPPAPDWSGVYQALQK